MANAGYCYYCGCHLLVFYNRIRRPRTPDACSAQLTPAYFMHPTCIDDELAQPATRLSGEDAALGQLSPHGHVRLRTLMSNPMQPPFVARLSSQHCVVYWTALPWNEECSFDSSAPHLRHLSSHGDDLMPKTGLECLDFRHRSIDGNGSIKCP